MNKILTAALLIGMMSSCTETNIDKVKTEYIIYDGFNPIEVVIIDSCQYLFAIGGSRVVLTHKGNCNNPVHKGGKQ